MKYLIALFLSFKIIVSCVWADSNSSSNDYAKLSLKFQNVVQCIAYADTPRNQDKLKILAPKGISVGRRFVSAAIDRKIKAEDWSNVVPMEYRLRIQGPTADFVVGRLSEANETKALTTIYTNCAACKTDEKLRHIRMNLLFDQYRCDAIRNSELN